MKTWLLAQLRYLDSLESLPEWSESLWDDVRAVIDEASRRAAVAGLPDAVKACQMRAGGAAPSLARELLAGCLAACRSPQNETAPEWLNIKEAAGKLGIGTKKMYQLCADGLIRHQKVGRQIRISPDDLTIATRPVKKRIAELEQCFK